MSYIIGVRTVLQSLVVALIHNPEYEGNGCFGTIFDVPSVWVRFTLTRFGNSIQNRPFLGEIETAYSFCHIE
jgi:hypothetical protein